MTFPKHFIWGAAAASYQVEGTAYENGRGLSVWDMIGYKRRFGLVYVDYPSGRRLPKDSAHWYRKVIATHDAAALTEEPR